MLLYCVYIFYGMSVCCWRDRKGSKRLSLLPSSKAPLYTCSFCFAYPYVISSYGCCETPRMHHRTMKMIQKLPAQAIKSEWLTVCEWSHIGPWQRPTRSHQSAACLLSGGRNGGDKSQLPSGNCRNNWVIKTDDVKSKLIFDWTNVHSSLHSHTSVQLWLTSVLALGFVLGISVCAAAVSGERQTDGGESKRPIFTPSAKSKQIGLLGEWTCLCPFHAECPFVMPPLLRKQCWGHNYCHNHAHVHLLCNDDEPWNNKKKKHFLGWISNRSLPLPFITVYDLRAGSIIITNRGNKLDRHFGFGCFHPHCPLNRLVAGRLAFHLHVSPTLWKSNALSQHKYNYQAVTEQMVCLCTAGNVQYFQIYTQYLLKM